MPTKGEIEAQTGGTVSQWFQFNWYFWHEHVTFVCRYVTACLCLGCGWLRFLSKEHNSLVQSVKFSCSVVSDSVTPWTAACQASLSTTNSWSLLKHISIESVMPSNHLILCHPLILLPSIFPRISSVQSHSRLQFFATPWIAARQGPLSITNSWSSLKLMSFSQWCHPVISSSVSPSLPASNPSQHRSLFQWVNSSHEVAKVLGFQP